MIEFLHLVDLNFIVKCIFSCRASSSEFVVPFRRFMKSLDTSFSVGMRFKMRFETEDAGERRLEMISYCCYGSVMYLCFHGLSYMLSCNRYTGVVTGMAELDPMR